jgi:periplasmic divalent cation tolerance protein
MTDKIVVLATCESEEQARSMARHLVEKRLAACVNVVPGVHSVYRWKDAIEEAQEWMLTIKSRRDLFDALRAEIDSLHGYEVPEIIALPIVDGSERYLAWIDHQLAAEPDLP